MLKIPAQPIDLAVLSVVFMGLTPSKFELRYLHHCSTAHGIQEWLKRTGTQYSTVNKKHT